MNKNKLYNPNIVIDIRGEVNPMSLISVKSAIQILHPQKILEVILDSQAVLFSVQKNIELQNLGRIVKKETHNDEFFLWIERN